MELIDTEIEELNGRKAKEDVQKETYIESEDFHSKLQRHNSSTNYSKPDKHILRRQQSKVRGFRINHRV